MKSPNLYFKLMFICLISFSFIPEVSFANEGAAPAEAHGEKKEEGGGGHGEKKEGEKAGAPEKKSTPEWVEVMAKLQTLKAKVKAKQEAVDNLIKEKNRENNPEKLKEIVKNLVGEHKELLKLSEEYEQQRSYFLYRYPEKSMSEERKYERIDVKPLDDIETQVSLDGKINKTLGKIRKQYGVDQQIAEELEKKKKKKQQDMQKSSITDPVVISK